LEAIMHTRQLTFPLPGNGSAVLTLPQHLPFGNLLALERSVTAALADLQREACGAGVDPGQIEYASWLQQLGALHH
jgi:hypothetical protein